MKEDIEILIEKKNDLKAAASVLKERFETWLKDKSIPVDERWDLWLRAPSEIKNHSSFIEHFKFRGEEISWYDDFYEQKGATVMLENVIESIAEDEEEIEPINNLKDQILERNLESFIYDW